MRTTQKAFLKTITESMVQKSCIEYLERIPCVAKVIRSNTGFEKKNYTNKNGITKTRVVRYLPKGHPDTYGFMKDGRAFYFEIKRPVGGIRSPEQISFIELARSHGCIANFITDVSQIQLEFKIFGYLK